jgi:two-component system sensor histidine kinase BaeS
MKTLFSRILLAQVVAVVLALAVVTLITRYSLTHGFTTFLERQETRVLDNIAPVLGDLYSRQGGWDRLRANPEIWQRIWWRSNRADMTGPRGPAPGSIRQLEGGPRAPGTGPEPEFRWLAQPGRGMLRERLFLLDATRVPLAGADPGATAEAQLKAVMVEGDVIGWIGFAPLDQALPPEAQRFLGGQLKITALALTAGLAVAAVLAWILARNVSRPVQSIGAAVRRLSDGDFAARADSRFAGEIGDLAERVNQLAATLEKNRTARQRWMADIAHELRTPVAVMKGEIEAVADGIREPDRRTIASLAEEADHLASMVDDLQALALADAGALDLRKAPVNLDELVRQALEAFANRLEERGVRARSRIAANVVVIADAQRLRQLLHNLLENSARYVEPGGRLEVSLTPGKAAVLRLEDSGPGVSDDQLARLFDRFYRVEGSRSRTTGGSGLGLSICRNIVEAHGGSIEAGHSPLGGLSIRVELPNGGLHR